MEEQDPKPLTKFPFSFEETCEHGNSCRHCCHPCHCCSVLPVRAQKKLKANAAKSVNHRDSTCGRVGDQYQRWHLCVHLATFLKQTCLRITHRLDLGTLGNNNVFECSSQAAGERRANRLPDGCGNRLRGEVFFPAHCSCSRQSSPELGARADGLGFEVSATVNRPRSMEPVSGQGRRHLVCSHGKYVRARSDSAQPYRYAYQERYHSTNLPWQTEQCWLMQRASRTSF